MRTKAVVVAYRGERYRIRTTAAAGTAAVVFVDPSASASTTAGVRHLIGRLQAMGFDEFRTRPARASQLDPFRQAGFAVTDELVVLERAATNGDAAFDVTTQRTIRGRDLDAVHALDDAAFAGEWRWDRWELVEAMQATSRNRSRALLDRHQRPIGYYIAGYQSGVGYLQRLAVHPDQQHNGVGRQLVREVVAWSAARHAHRISVNTHPTNVVALRLYESEGFVRQNEPMTIVGGRCDLDVATASTVGAQP